MVKVLSYGTKVPCAGHFCALPEAIIQNNLLGSLIMIPDRGNSFPMFAKLERNEKETNLFKIRLASLIFFTSQFLFSRYRRYTSRCSSLWLEQSIADRLRNSETFLLHQRTWLFCLYLSHHTPQYFQNHPN